jgi:hypothetical protein
MIGVVYSGTRSSSGGNSRARAAKVGAADVGTSSTRAFGSGTLVISRSSVQRSVDVHQLIEVFVLVELDSILIRILVVL